MSEATEASPGERAQATARVEAWAIGWLWQRGCRVIAREVGLRAYPYGATGYNPGLSRARLCTPWEGRWRVDLVGLDEDAKRIFVVEVKGTRADMVRERYDDARGKWPLYVDGAVHILALADGLDAPSTLPAHWQVVRSEVSHNRLRPSARPLFDGGEEFAVSMRACALALTTGWLKREGAGVLKTERGRKDLIEKMALS